MGANQSQPGSLTRSTTLSSSLENHDNEGEFVPREGYQNLEGSICPIEKDIPDERKRFHGSRTKSLFELSSRSTLKVVHGPVDEDCDAEVEAMVQRLEQIPMAFKILEESSTSGLFRRRTTHAPGLTRPLDPRPLSRLGPLYSDYVKKSSVEICRTQQDICKRIMETNVDIGRLLKSYLKYQARFAYCAKKLDDVNSISICFTKCQSALDTVLRTAHVLNDMLPDDEKLEPLVLTDETRDTVPAC